MGLLFGPQCIVGVLAGATVSATMLALVMGNAGGAWDNAKKYVERGDFGKHLAKNSPVHSANVSGDTVGDPFKDTSGERQVQTVKKPFALAVSTGACLSTTEGRNLPLCLFTIDRPVNGHLDQAHGHRVARAC